MCVVCCAGAWRQGQHEADPVLRPYQRDHQPLRPPGVDGRQRGMIQSPASSCTQRCQQQFEIESSAALNVVTAAMVSATHVLACKQLGACAAASVACAVLGGRPVGSRVVAVHSLVSEATCPTILHLH